MIFMRRSKSAEYNDFRNREFFRYHLFIEMSLSGPTEKVDIAMDRSKGFLSRYCLYILLFLRSLV